ncbi:MAG: anchored repeat ABC transporter, substrate-binding protein [Pseudonocardiaceae bacterium]
MRLRAALLLMGAAGAAVALAACTAVDDTGPTGGRDDRLTMVVSTEILADLARHIGGDRVTVETVIPPGGDPHSYEPNPGDARKVARADVAFTNHLLLEEHALIKLFDTNVPPGSPNISLAEHAEPYGASLIPLVESVDLDTIWFGIAVRGAAPQRSDEIELRATELDGPGSLAAYLTHALGDPEIYFNSADGLGDADVVVLPSDAHTHLNWAFSAPGEYHLTFAATLRTGGEVRPVGTGRFSFAVGTDPRPVAARTGAAVLDSGHTDVTVDLNTTHIVARTDEQGDIPAPRAVIEVPDRAIEQVPTDSRFAFLGPPGSKIWQLPQAVLGKHVHGEIDPHLWLDVRNAKAYVHAMAATLGAADPAGAATYEANRDAYSTQLDDLHREVAVEIGAIPQANRHLVTTHDAFGYLARAYGMTVAGFVVPNPAQEPSAAQVRDLTEAVRRLRVPAVFVEPNLAERAGVLRQVAADAGVDVCQLHGDTFSPMATNYVAMMRWNAQELRRCLAKEGSR